MWESPAARTTSSKPLQGCDFAVCDGDWREAASCSKDGMRCGLFQRRVWANERHQYVLKLVGVRK
jgi:hypothetical protein